MSADSLLPGLLSTAGLTTGIGAALPKTDSPQKIRDSATQFESLLVGQILKSAHDEEGGGWLGAGEDQTAGPALQMADEYFAQAITAHGGLGLAKVIAGGLEKASMDKGSADPPNRSNPAK